MAGQAKTIGYRNKLQASISQSISTIGAGYEVVTNARAQYIGI